MSDINDYDDYMLFLELLRFADIMGLEHFIYNKQLYNTLLSKGVFHGGAEPRGDNQCGQEVAA